MRCYVNIRLLTTKKSDDSKQDMVAVENIQMLIEVP